jgi:hypothetical protein
MNSLKHIIGVLLIVLLIGCNDRWDKHYSTEIATINENVWDAIQRDTNLSKFVGLVRKYNFDTLFVNNKTYTFFIPSNTALTDFIDSASTTSALLRYNISEFFILSENISGLRKIQTLGKKFALFNKVGKNSFFDGVPLNFESPLYLNGKYYIMDALALPKLNLYEYFALNNLVFKSYIDDLDTIILDKTKSRPIGFDEFGNTIYDTVAIIKNRFEMKFFPIKQESRYKSATIVFPKTEDYNEGLNLMAQTLGGNYHDYRDIPMNWQKKILIPYLLEHGVFENMMEEPEFLLDLSKNNDTIKLKNILGDSVVIKYEVAEKALCSNGYAYNYKEFKVPDTLWNSTYRFEAEHLVRNIGTGRWAWKDDVIVSNKAFAPVQDKIIGASKDSTLRVMLTPNKYNGTYTVEFNIDRLFPRKYLMVVRTNSNYGGKYRVYVNGTLLKTIDYFSLTGSFYNSVIPGIRYLPTTNRYISYDLWVENLTTYGEAKIKFEYYGPSTNVAYSALVLDYIDFKPY